MIDDSLRRPSDCGRPARPARLGRSGADASGCLAVAGRSTSWATYSIPIDDVTIAIAGGILTAAAALLGWIARTFFKRMDRDKDEVIALIKESDKRSSENIRATNGQFEKLDGKIDSTRKELNSIRKELDEKGEKHHGETLNTLINLTLQGGRHEGPGRVKDDSAARLGQHSPRQIDEPSSTHDVEADPEQDALRNDIAMVPVAGIGTEPAHGPSLAHQAAPGQQQAPQRADKTGTEPDADESAETAPGGGPGWDAGDARRSGEGTRRRAVSTSRTIPDCS